MRTVEEVRRLRLTALREKYGTLSELNEKLGMLRRDSTLSQILNNAGAAGGKGKDMGSTLARRIEQALDLEVGWMDTDPVYDSPAQRLSLEAIQLAREFDRRPAHERQAMLSLWRTLTEVTQQSGPQQPAADAAAAEQQEEPALPRKAN